MLGSLWISSLLVAPHAGAAFDCGAYLQSCPVQIDNSGRAWFWSNEKLTGDALGDGTLRGGVFQVYRRSGNTTTLVSRGPDGKPIPFDALHRTSASLEGVSPDGQRVYVKTEASLVPEDGDAGHGYGSWDYYELASGRYTLITTGPLDGPFSNPNALVGQQRLWASDDGSHVYFETGQRLTADDLDNSSDVYERSNGMTTLVSTGPEAPVPDPSNPSTPPARFLGATPDGTTAFFSTPEHLTSGDSESTEDIFSWRSGVTSKVTNTASDEADSVWESFNYGYFGGVANDGSLFYVAFSPQTADDTDSYEDLYVARPNGTTERLTATPPGSSLSGNQSFLRGGAVSQDGSRAFFITSRSLLPEDRDQALDIYMRSEGQFQLVSIGTHSEEVYIRAVSRDGHRVYFDTWDQLTPGDSDNQVDVYEWADGRMRLVSPASDGRQASALFGGISPNGRYVAFSTVEPLLGSDTDSKSDVYVVDMGNTAGSAVASRAKRRGRRRRHGTRRLRLVTAEAIPPRMGIGRRGSLGGRGAWMSLRCPKVERTGPCRGRVLVLNRRSRKFLGWGRFRIATGHRGRVLIRGKRLPRSRRMLVALARVRGVDRLGNSAVVKRRVVLRRSRRPRR